MRPPLCIFGLALAWLITSSAQAHSRGFDWFFASLCTSRNLFGAACSRDLLCLRVADGQWSDIRFQRVYGRTSHAAFRIAGDGDES
jgi:hypothetical protein